MKPAHWSDTAEGKCSAVEYVTQQHGRRPSAKEIGAAALMLEVSAKDLTEWLADSRYSPESTRGGAGTGQTAADEEAVLTALAEKHSGLPVSALATATDTPLAVLLASEDDGLTEDARAGVVKKLLAFLTQGTNGISVKWVRSRTQRSWHLGYTYRLIPMPWGIPRAGKIGKQMLVIEAEGQVKEVIPFARVHSVKKKRMELSVLRPSHQLSEKMIARDIALLQDYVNGSRINGSEFAKICGETRANISVRRRSIDQRIRESTGGKSGMPGLRHNTDPRKGIKTGPRNKITTEQ